MDPITIVGSGPVGTLLAMYLARRGFPVTVFERNADVREHRVARGSSINLTLCLRGLDALDRVGAGDAVRQIGVPVRGRMIHLRGGSIQQQPYGNRGEALLSVTRNELNAALLEHAQRHCGIDVRFGQKCTGLDLPSLEVAFTDEATGRVHRHAARWVIGADGAFSAVRSQLQKCYGLNAAQEDSTLAYKQLNIPASPLGWTGVCDSLHIWPRGQHMLLALPNRDRSFTAALLLPMLGEQSHESITDASQLVALFEGCFPDAREKIPNLVENYFACRPIPMVTIRCSPWSHAQRVLLLGDAAHAMFPSYGQGANAGFEDCAVLDECLEEAGGDLAIVFAQMENRRRPQTDAMADLSKQHLLVLCSALGTAERSSRDRLEAKLNQLYPSYLPLYSMVSFTRMPYAEAMQADRERRSAIDALAALLAGKEDLNDAASEGIIREFVLKAGLVPGRDGGKHESQLRSRSSGRPVAQGAPADEGHSPRGDSYPAHGDR